MTRVIIEVRGQTDAQELMIATDIEQGLRDLHYRGGLMNPELDSTEVELEISTYVDAGRAKTPVNISAMTEIVMGRLKTGIPPCETCGNTDRDHWILDPAENEEECEKCGHRRPIVKEEER